jgi:hypothetical protein
VADLEYFEWLGDPDATKLPFINREIAGVKFNGPGHIGATGDKDKIKFFSESEYFKKSTKTAFELSGGQSADDVVESADVGSQGLSDGSATKGQGSSTPG